MTTIQTDNEHLRLLSIFHYVIGGLGILFAFFPVIHIVIGLYMVISPESLSSSEHPPPEFLGWLFLIMGGVFFLLGQALAITIIISGRFINKRKNYLFSFIVACVMCLMVPFGTILGIFTIIVLSRDSVKNIYNNQNN